MTSVELSLIVLKTRWIDQVRAFYACLGLSFQEEQHGRGPIHYSTRLDHVVFEVYPLPDNEEADIGVRLGFTVERLADVLGLLVENGATVRSKLAESDWGLRAVVNDPDGRAVELYQRSVT